MQKTKLTIDQISSFTGLKSNSIRKRVLGLVYSTIKGKRKPLRVYEIADLPSEWKKKIATKMAPTLPAEPAQQALEEAVNTDKSVKSEKLLALSSLTEAGFAIATAKDTFMTASQEYSKISGYKFQRGALRTKKGEVAFLAAYNSGQLNFDKSMLDIIGKSIHWTTLNTWFKKRDAEGVAGLAPKQRGGRNREETTLTDKQQRIIIALIYKSPHVGPVNLRKGLQGELGKINVPSVRVIGRFQERWTERNQEVFDLHLNPANWKNKYMFGLGDACGDIDRLYQLVEGDSTPTDIMLNVDGKLVRYALVGLIDLYSRKAQLVLSPTSSGESVVISLRKWILNNGIPEALRIDNGKDWISHRVQSVLRSLEIDTKLCEKFKSEEKGTVERFFRTFSHGIMELAPHFVGHNVSERQAIEERKSFAQRIMKKGGEPVELAATPQEFQEFCDTWCDYVYGEDIHSTIGMTPNEKVRSWRHPITKITNIRALDMLLLQPAYKQGRRKIGKSGVQVESGPYYPMYGAKEFAAHAGKWVYVLIDPTDMGRVVCYLEKDGGKREYFCEAVNLAFKGIDRAAFASEVKRKQDKIVKGQLRQLKKDAKKEGVEHAHLKYMALRKDQKKGILEFPPEDVEHTTPQLEEAAQAIIQQDQRAAAQEDPYAEVEQEAVPVSKKKQNVINLITDDDYYRNIRRRVEGGKGLLTLQEVEFLRKFYTTLSGKAAKRIDKNLIEEIGCEAQKKEKRA